MGQFSPSGRALRFKLLRDPSVQVKLATFILYQPLLISAFSHLSLFQYASALEPPLLSYILFCISKGALEPPFLSYILFCVRTGALEHLIIIILTRIRTGALELPLLSYILFCIRKGALEQPIMILLIFIKTGALEPPLLSYILNILCQAGQGLWNTLL